MCRLWQVFMPDQPCQNILHFFNAHIDMLNHSPVEHPCRHIPPPTFLLQVVETLEDDTFPMGEPVSDVWEIITWIMGRHRYRLFDVVFMIDSNLWLPLLQLLFDTE